MVPINKGHEPLLVTVVHDKGQHRGGVLLRVQAGDVDQRAPVDEQEAARQDEAAPGRLGRGQELPRILSM